VQIRRFDQNSIMHNGPQVQIRPARESDTTSFCDAVRAVAAEKWHLASVDGFSLEQIRAFLKKVVDGSQPQVMAVVKDKVVGFCEKVELEVFSDNVGVVRLYDSFGFSHEGLKVRGRKLEDRYQDVKLMALWL
jgi:hypothetical protein